MNQHRFNLTFDDYIDDKEGRQIQFTQLTIFDRKTNRTIRLKLPAIYKHNPRLFVLDLSNTNQSIHGFAKYRKYPQSPELYKELLFLQKTQIYLENNNFITVDLITDILQEETNG